MKINKEELQKIVNDLEEYSSYFYRNDLYKEIVNTEWAKTLNLTYKDVCNYCKSLNINVKSPEEYSENQDKDIDILVEKEVGRMEIIKTISVKGDDNWQDVSTPLDICDEMCSLVLDATHFVVLFSLEFLEILVKRKNINPQNIMFFADNKLEAGIAKKMYDVNARSLNKDAVIENGVFNNEALTKILKEGIDIMKFDKLAVIMNPPYQMNNDKGDEKTTHSSPLYHKFIETIIDDLFPNYLVSINPSRWMVGGRGLDDFRSRMIPDRRIKKIVHFPGRHDIFPTVSIAGGVNYFIWDKEYNGTCEFKVGNSTTERFLDEFDIVLQDNQAMSILKKIINKTSFWMNKIWAIQTPFGLVSSFKDWKNEGINCYARDGKHYVDFDSFIDKNKIISKWKVCTSKATSGNITPDSAGSMMIVSNFFLIEPDAICTQTYIVVNIFDTKKEAENFVSYMKTKFFRFMLGLRMLTQDVNKEKFAWVPDVEDYSDPWTDEELYKKFNLTRQEREYIESKIKELK